LYKLVQGKKGEKGCKCQSNLFFSQKLISAHLIKSKKVKKATKSHSKVVKVSKVGKLFYKRLQSFFS